MKCGPFPMWPAFPTSEYYDPLRLPLDHPSHFPGSPVIGRASLPSPRRRRGRDGSPEFPGRPFARSTPYTPEGSSAPAPGTRTLSVAFALRGPARLPLCPARKAGPLNDAYSGLHSRCRPHDCSAPLRTRPLDHARGLHYQGPRRLPGPDSHRQAALNLSLLRHVDLPFFMAPRAVSAHSSIAAVEGSRRAGSFTPIRAAQRRRRGWPLQRRSRCGGPRRQKRPLLDGAVARRALTQSAGRRPCGQGRSREPVRGWCVNPSVLRFQFWGS